MLNNIYRKSLPSPLTAASGLLVMSAILISGAVIGGCKSSEEEDFYPAEESQLSLRVSPTNVILGAFEATQKVSVESNSSWKVTDPENHSWLKLNDGTEAHGTANGEFTISAENNLSGKEREATIEVAGPSKIETINVKQLVSSVYVTPQELSCTSAGGTLEFSVRSEFPWKAQCDESWITLDVNEGEGSLEEAQKVHIQVAPYFVASKERTGKILIKSPNGLFDNQIVTVTQSVSSTSIIYVTPTELAAKSSGDNISFTVTSKVPWRLSCRDSWITPDRTSAEGNGETLTVSLAVNANRTQTNRSATLLVESPDKAFETVLVKVNQPTSGLPIIHVTPTSFIAKPEGETLKLTIIRKTKCSPLLKRTVHY